ncbi:MAG: DUF1674 domain-containing protein [Emcibacteraceae bacterium]|nr:DUF1674 domain-containing protein [Emcibacteraceae bacterium]MDG1995201.1 DUF1674 domain-containing protein [Emcibacteraceae bacterium]
MEKENKVTPNKADQRDQTSTSDKKEPPKSKELGGREGPDPVRYGDWENKGIASDF